EIQTPSVGTGRRTGHAALPPPACDSKFKIKSEASPDIHSFAGSLPHTPRHMRHRNRAHLRPNSKKPAPIKPSPLPTHPHPHATKHVSHPFQKSRRASRLPLPPPPHRPLPSAAPPPPKP
uniref:Uncharacterized protein n=1 Tax=Aegilops tauschii subsp. strangulata TaxID=200361 RepID=A0A453N5P2_AEGTS